MTREERQSRIEDVVTAMADVLTIGLPGGVGFTLALYETGVEQPFVQVASSNEPDQIAPLLREIAEQWEEKAKSGDFRTVTPGEDIEPKVVN